MIDENRRRYLGLCAAGTGLALSGCLSSGNGDETPQQGAPSDDDDNPDKVDDWQYEPDSRGSGRQAISALKPAARVRQMRQQFEIGRAHV